MSTTSPTTTTSQALEGPISADTAGVAIQRGPALLQPLRLRDFRLVFTGETISLIGDQFHFVALAWLTLQLTGSGLALGTVLMVAANVWIAMAIGAGIGVGIGFVNVRVVAWLQARTPEHLRGRVMSLIMLSGVGLAPISLAIAGAVIDLGAVDAAFAVGGGIIVAAAASGLLSGIPQHMRDGAAA